MKHRESRRGIVSLSIAWTAALSVLLLSCGTACAEFTNGNWPYRMTITFAGYDRPETLTNFPALVVFSTNTTGFAYDQFESTSGGDLRFTDSTGTNELNYEIESWSTNTNSYVWVQVPALTNSAHIYAYWGNANGTNPPSYTTNGATWSNSYAGVWHFKETPTGSAGDIKDSSSNGKHATSYAMEASDQVGGLANGCLNYDNASSEYVRSTLSGTALSQLTVAFWVNPDVTLATQRGIFQWANVLDSGAPFALVARESNTTDLKFYVDGGYRPDYSVANGSWSHVVITLNSANLWRFYVNGTSRSTYQDDATHDYQASAASVYFGNGYNGYSDGQMDEARVADVERSSNWIWSCWMNQGSNDTFCAYTWRVGVYVQNYMATNITVDSADLVGDLTTTGGAPTEVYVYWGLTNGYQVKADWATNAYLGTNDIGLITNNISSLSGATKYFYSFYATNFYGGEWASPSASFSTLGAPTIDNDGGATNIMLTSATLRGEVLGGGPDPAVYVCWGTNSGGTVSTGAWENVEDMGEQGGAFATNVALPGGYANLTNYYCCYATNSSGDDWAPAVTNFRTAGPAVSISDAVVVEGPAETPTNAVFTITLSATSAIDVVVYFSASNGTATVAGSDYDATNGVVTFGAYQDISKTVTVVVNGDNSDEYPGENFYLNLTNIVNGTISDGEGECTITDDDDTQETKTWDGTSGNWNSATNWIPQGLPGNTDDVIINGGTVTISGPTAYLDSFTNNGGTVVFATTNAILRGKEITINGTVTHNANTDTAAPWAMDNRIWISCSNLTLSSGVTINLNGKGYVPGAGPGKGGSTTGGGSHGGKGVWGGPTYGLAEAPEQPGSGGSLLGEAGGKGGGAVRIDASGHVAIDGSITANGVVNNKYRGAGAGGSIWIQCRTFGGSGALTAISGAPSSTGGGGGGGRIAIVYDAAAQTNAPTPAVLCDAYGSSDGGKLGTLYFTDAGFFPYAVVQGSGQFICPVTNVTLPSLSISNAWLQIMGLDRMVVTGMLKIAGSVGRLDWNRVGYSEMSCGADVVLTNNGSLYFYSAPTNASHPDCGVLVSVTGQLAVMDNADLYLLSDSTNGGSLRLIVGSLHVDSSGRISAAGSGYTFGYGPGTTGGRGGASHGGRGNSGASLYGIAGAPVQPGSGSSASETKGAGGGVVRIDVSGEAFVDGIITARGNDGYHYGAGAGGSIWIDCDRLSGIGLIAARGGTATGSIGGGAGGGRIAVLYDPVSQTNGSTPQITFDVGGGWDNNGNGAPGSLYLTDTSFYPYTLLTGGARIEIPGFTSWSPSSLTIDGARIDLFTITNLNVQGDLKLMGDQGWLVFKNESYSRISCGSGLTLTNGARLYLTSGPTNASGSDHGVLVSVIGAVELVDNAKVFLSSCATNGGSSLWTMKSLNVSTSSYFQASGRGYAPLYGPGCNPGGSRSGGSYGGRGGGGSGPTYGSSNAPVNAGSGGAELVDAGYGGGVVRLQISEDAIVDGQILADGLVNSKYRGAGAGGSIWIQCRQFSGIGTIRARSYEPTSLGRGGGGGRIAIWYTANTNGWTGSLTYPDSVLGVDGGVSGTIVWIYNPPPQGTLFIFR